ncbi:membrane metallo-endopeptidase-like 1 [Patiria miniata]|uniref:Uncharacterized protein n=1 Tax=Patiria miniata TaxID=46514 RepID=A0A914BHL3_PATMI|nr:membrane metallo-endopeptidase-like 1 [Patiria miniata]
MEDKHTTSKTQLALEDPVASKSPSKIPLILLGIFAVAIIALTVTTVVVVLQKNDIAAELDKLKANKPPVPVDPDREVCTTKQCYDSAYEYLSNMNQSVNPCDNFYEYGCGGWVQRYTALNLTSPSTNILSTLGDDLTDKLKVIFERSPVAGEPSSYHIVRNDYQSCVDIDTIYELGAKPLTDVLTSLGGWPVLGSTPAGGNWNATEFDFEKLWAAIRGKYYVQLIVATDTYPDPNNTAKYKLDAFTPDFVVPTVDTEMPLRRGVRALFDEREDSGKLAVRILLDENYSEERKAYLQYMIDIAVALGANETVALEDMTKLIEFESHMANLTELHPDDEIEYIEYTLKQIGMGVIDWTRFYQLMLPASVDPGVTDDEPIINYRPDYIGNVTLWLRDQDDRVKANYMIWRLVSELVPFMSETFLAIRQKYQEATDSTSATTPRWRTCAKNANNLYKYISGRMYVDDHFPEDAKQKTLEMVRTLQTAFKSMLKTNAWLQEADKATAIEKADAMDIAIGYPEWIKDNAKLDAKYADVTAKDDEYLQNNVRYREWTSQGEMALLRQDVDKDESLWATRGPAIVNAFHSPYVNGILFPAGILQPPFYHKDLPWYSNYGGIGVVIGHEITHGFDNRGRQFDKDGNYRVWWSQESIENFVEEKQCIIDQYSEFVMPQNNRMLNGVRTQSENIADNGGLREAYKAYIDNIGEQPRLPGMDFTEEQMFFLSYSQLWCQVLTLKGVNDYIDLWKHSPGRYRAIGALQNNEAFSAAFNCPAGSYMNPDVKCRVW